MTSFQIAHRATTARPRFSVRGLLDRFAAADAAYRSRRDLRALDDRMLRDIGVSRGEVDAEMLRPMPW